jgi:pimeloyl-ACP methyl ester carboxylesterase
MRSQRGLWWLGLLNLTALLASGCVWRPEPLPTREEFIGLLSKIILEPRTTCETLRDDFGLADLPVIRSPLEAGLTVEELWLPVNSSDLVRVWYLPAAAERGTVVLSMGSAGEMACYLYVARLLIDGGWSVVMYEYRGFGLSTGQPSLSTLADDLEQVVQWARERSGHEQVSLMGVSLGTIPSVAVAVRRPEWANGVVLDSPVALGEQLERFWWLLDNPVNALIALLDPELISESIIHRIRDPLLVFAYDRDLLTTPRTVQTLYDRAPQPKQLVRFTGLTHAAGAYFNTAEYVAHLDSFLASVWSSAED